MDFRLDLADPLDNHLPGNVTELRIRNLQHSIVEFPDLVEALHSVQKMNDLEGKDDYRSQNQKYNRRREMTRTIMDDSVLKFGIS